MLIEFIKLRIRESTRSADRDKNLAANIILALLVLYMVAVFLMFGLFIDKIIKSSPDRNIVEIFNRALLYYFGFELLVRFFMQQTPAMSIAPFLHLPVKRSFILRFLLARSVINPVNYISFLIFVPFAIKAVAITYSGTAACWWLLALLLITLFVIS